MKKHNIKKLALRREMIRHLDNERLGRAAGGASIEPTFCLVTECGAPCPSGFTCTSCPCGGGGGGGGGGGSAADKCIHFE